MNHGMKNENNHNNNDDTNNNNNDDTNNYNSKMEIIKLMLLPLLIIMIYNDSTHIYSQSE